MRRLPERFTEILSYGEAGHGVKVVAFWSESAFCLLFFWREVRKTGIFAP
ncbi:MAG: hypothetical protein Q4C96_02915 [Planctomycetia bacterium]|nr:hypothetical protein [Planctomycetia bacterium]MDO4550184.1 hypothetical protein [Planctomycetia bacterium]MDO4550185.1 hypothetical protein [Planctomycetia bacterium]